MTWLTRPAALVLPALLALTASAGAQQADLLDPGTTRLFHAPTARSLPVGKPYVGVYGFLVPFAQVGVTDRFSIGGGALPLYPDRPPFWVTPKLQVLDTDRAQVAIGSMHAFVQGFHAGVAYGVVTTGVPDAALTAAVGVAYAGDGGKAVVAMVGGERRIGRRAKFLSENYLWSGGTGVLINGVRIYGRKFSADLGLGIPIGAAGVMAFPVVNLVYVF
jgi:hypothetical protein